MNYSDALNVILSKQSLGIMPGLARISKLLDEMGNPQNELKIIHIAGTNGKGTVAHTIADTLIQNGCTVGLFTSPWIIDYREQIQLNGKFISEKDFTYYVEKYQHNDCSEFEMLTAIMYKYFADKKVDYAVIECGMGGRGDATNVEKENVCSVLTSISLDHTAFLGSTIEEITYEKEGIIRNSPCFRYSDSGDYLKDNLDLAKRVIAYLGYDNNIQLSHLPARQQVINNVLIDGGHNVNAAQALAGRLKNEVALIGMMADKDVDGYLSLVAPRCKMIITTTPNNSRSLLADELRLTAERYCGNVVSIANPLDALSFAKQNGLSLVCGSFFLVRDIIKELS